MTAIRIVLMRLLALGVLASVLLEGCERAPPARSAPAAVLAAPPSPPPGAAPPNIVLIISDDQGFTDYGFMGHPVIQTPRLDRLAAESLVYTKGRVTTALCSPSLASLLTGLYPHQHKITGNDPTPRVKRDPWLTAFEEHPRLPAMLASAGIESFQTGKFWLGHYSRAGFTQGMTVQGHHGDAGLAIGRTTMQPAFDFIDRAHAGGTPFFLWYAPMLPHTPHDPPDEYAAKYIGSGANMYYYAMCEWFDHTCGRLLDHLDRPGLRENTLVIYLCDNGWPDSAKGSPSEMGLRTPIMLRWPGRIAPRRDDVNLACALDIAPTILKRYGLEPTPEMPGIDLLDADAVAARDTLFAENYTHDMADVEHPAHNLRARSCITRDWKLTVWQHPQPGLWVHNGHKPTAYRELYHIGEDPLESKNLIDQHPDIVAALLEKLDRWWDPTDDLGTSD